MTVIQRPLKGSRLSSFYPVKSLPSLSSLDSAFQLQEYISLLIRLDVHDVERIVSLPGKSPNTQDTGTPLEELKNEEKDSDKDGKGDVTVDEPCWIYEQLRSAAYTLPRYVGCAYSRVTVDVSLKISLTHLSRHCKKNARARHAPR